MDLLAEYIAAMERFDALAAYPVHPDLVTGEDGSFYRWKPRRWDTDPAALQGFYSGLGLSGTGSERLPILYEELILTYRWAAAEMGSHCLLANEPAADLSPLAGQIARDPQIFSVTKAHGYVRFATAPGGNYDAVCFDLNRIQGRDCPVVKLDHEEVLCNSRIRVVAELAPSFRSLVSETVSRYHLGGETPA